MNAKKVSFRAFSKIKQNRYYRVCRCVGVYARCASADESGMK